MPLKHGCDRKTIAANAHELMASGRPKDQAWAIAFDKARKDCPKLKGKLRDKS